MSRNVPIFVLIAVVSIGIGFVAGTEYKAYEIRESLQKSFSSFGLNVPNNDDSAENVELLEKDVSVISEINNSDGKIMDHVIGDAIELATLKVQTKSVEEGNMTNDGTPIVAQEGTKFVFVTLNVTNITKLPLNFPFGFPVIIDDQERTYNPYDRSIGSVVNFLDYRELAPGIPEEGVMTYQLPADAEHYYLLMAKGGTEDYYRIKLK